MAGTSPFARSARDGPRPPLARFSAGKVRVSDIHSLLAPPAHGPMPRPGQAQMIDSSVEQARHRALVADPTDRLAHVLGDRQHPDLARDAHALGRPDAVTD